MRMFAGRNLIYNKKQQAFQEREFAPTRNSGSGFPLQRFRAQTRKRPSGNWAVLKGGVIVNLKFSVTTRWLLALAAVRLIALKLVR